MHIKTMTISLMLAAAPPALAEEPPIVDAFLGNWASDADALGGPARSTMAWSSALDGAFTHLEYRIEMRPGEAQSAVFEGAAFYKYDGEGAYRAFWADSNGDLHPVAAVREGASLVADWGRAGAKQGRTRYELVGDDEMRVTDWLLTDDGWRMFNRNSFTRASSASE